MPTDHIYRQIQQPHLQIFHFLVATQGVFCIVPLAHVGRTRIWRIRISPPCTTGHCNSTFGSIQSDIVDFIQSDRLSPALAQEEPRGRFRVFSGNLRGELHYAADALVRQNAARYTGRHRCSLMPSRSEGTANGLSKRKHQQTHRGT